LPASTAFSYLLRYSRPFLLTRYNGLTAASLTLVIAALDFYDTHFDITEELGIRLLRV
jgi:hypothetical protein